MSYEHLKIGKLVQTVLKPLIISKATKQEISKMQELEYSKDTFGIQYPLLLKTTSSVAEKHYYSDLFTINGETYRLCCEWYEKEKNNDRPYVEKWIKEHETKVATFADVVMEEPEYTALSSKDINVSSNKSKKRSALSDILKTLDPVAFHSEYHSSRGVKERATVANGKWIFRWEKWNNKSYIMDENGRNKEYLELNKKNVYREDFTFLCGMNNKGIWFVTVLDMNGKKAINDCEYEPEFDALICFNPETENEKIIPFNASKYEVMDVYIYEDTIYYIGWSEIAGKKLVKIDSCGKETVLYANSEARLEKLCADANRVVFRISGDDWCFMDTNSYKKTFFKKEDISSYLDDFFDIKVVDLKNNTIWTTMTKEEQIKYNVCSKDLIARNLEKIIFDEDYRTESSYPIIFKNGLREYYRGWYFDGKNYYTPKHYTQLNRYDRDGREYSVGWAHGSADIFLVSESYVFTNYDTFAISRLPRNFSTTSEISKNNPEASFIFDDDERSL